MGRLKESLIDRPPTIGDLRRQGVVAFRVKCLRPCKRVGRVPLEALRLPDDTIARQIPKLRRFRCEACDRYVATVEPIWPVPAAEPVGTVDAQGARWVVVLKGADGREMTSSALWSRLHAVQFAEQQSEEGYEVLRIEGPSGIIDAHGPTTETPQRPSFVDHPLLNARRSRCVAA